MFAVGSSVLVARLKGENDLKQLTINYLLILLLFLSFLMEGIVLNYIFIVIYDLGISGAAYSTGISQALIIFILLPHFFSKKASLKIIKPIGSWIDI